MGKQNYLSAFQISLLYISGVVGGMIFDENWEYVLLGNVITFLTFLTCFRCVARKLVKDGFSQAVEVFNLDNE